MNIAALRELWEKTTREEWTVQRVPIQSSGGSNTCWKIGRFAACIYDDRRPREWGISEQENAANARFIAAAHTAFPALLDVVEAAKRADAANEECCCYPACQTGTPMCWVCALHAALAKLEG